MQTPISSGMRRAHPRQSGSVLITAIVLLLLAGVMTLLALNVGVFEQRTTGNDLRAKMTHEVAEAGLAQAFEFLMRQNNGWLTDSSRWEKCGSGDNNFPCGAVEQFEPDGVTERRSTLYRLRSTTNPLTGFDTALSGHMLPLAPLASNITTTGNGEMVAYGVGPLLCRAERPLPTDPPETPVRCGDGSGSLVTNLNLVTFVSISNLPGETARTTLTQTIGTYPLLDNLVGKPPLTASGSADVTGGLQIVTNPNSGGTGVPVSIWTRKDVDKTGTPNTCYADEFFRYTKNNVTPTLVPATCPVTEPNCKKTIQCDQCQCDVNGAPTSLSYDNSGNVQDEGIDILDVEGTSATALGVAPHVGTNGNVRSDALSYAAGVLANGVPICEFPPDMFKFVFGVSAWSDNDADCFAETKLTGGSYTNPNTGVPVPMGYDEAWLFENAAKVIPANDAAHTYGGVTSASLLKPGQSATSGYLNASASGIIWCQTGCNIGSNQVVGSPLNPVLLILDGPDVRIQGTVWGFVFIRSLGNTLSPVTGGSAELRMNAGAAVYGSIVVQGQVVKINATAALIYDGTVLARLEAQAGVKPATLPGAWNDRRSY